MRLSLPFEGRNRITSRYGDRILNGAPDWHPGFDFVGVDSDIVRAPFDCVVGTSAIVTDHADRTWEWGNFIRLDGMLDGRMIYIFLCHLDERFVERGQAIKRGDEIGRMGNTGYSFGAHTHVEIRNADAVQLNPAPFFGIQNEIGLYENEEENDMDGKEIAEELIEYRATLPESEWSRNEGGFRVATENGIMDGSNPLGFITREQFAAVLYRLGLLDEK